jgi:signal transduction histidine kinase
VLRNLTRNALQAMPTGGRLLLSTQLAPGGRAAEARVADTGPGLPPETRAHLFEPFFTTRPDGTGLGLAIAREIALAHRGDLLASDAPPASGVQTAGPSARSGPGALFTLRLPLHDP